MRSVADWLLEYGQSHTDRTNKLLHWICVPLIVLAVIGFVWSIPVPRSFAQISPWLNWATLASVFPIAYYVLLSPRLAAGITIAFLVMFGIVNALRDLPWPLWATSLAIFVGAWIGQFVGHAVEGTRPSFFKDAQFLLIGPLWLVASLYRALRVPY
jgi:uncharacterized membrane protein YGL010W